MLGGEQFSAQEIECAIRFVRSLKVLRDGLLACPVARLQVRFRLDFRRALALADALVARRVWEIVMTASGLRGARLLESCISHHQPFC